MTISAPSLHAKMSPRLRRQ